MARIMYDGINSDAPRIAQIPSAIDLVAGYIDGDYAWSDEDWGRFPNSTHVRIAVHPTTDDGHVLDCETGNATPQEAVNWVLTRRHSGADPTVYCNETEWATVRAAFSTHDVLEPYWWVARYDGAATIPAGAIAKQYKTTASWDESVVADYWPGVDPAPEPAPSAAPQLEEDEDMSTTSVNGRAGLSWPQGSRHVVQVTYDPHAGDPALRVVLALTTGPWVAPEWKPADGKGAYEIPAQYRATCCGVILEGAAAPVYDAVAA